MYVTWDIAEQNMKLHQLHERDILRSGLLWKRNRSSLRRWKQYYFVLNRLWFVCYRKGIPPEKNGDSKFMIDLAALDRIEHLYRKGRPTCCLVLAAGGARLQLRAANETQTDEWVHEIQEAARICKRRQKVQVELRRASFKRDVEKNVREKYRHSLPEVEAEKVPAITYLRKTSSDESDESTLGQMMAAMTPTGLGQRSISMDDQLCEQPLHSRVGRELNTLLPRIAGLKIQAGRMLKADQLKGQSRSIDSQLNNKSAQVKDIANNRPFPRFHKPPGLQRLNELRGTSILGSWNSSLNLVPEEDCLGKISWGSSDFFTSNSNESLPKSSNNNVEEQESLLSDENMSGKENGEMHYGVDDLNGDESMSVIPTGPPTPGDLDQDRVPFSQRLSEGTNSRYTNEVFFKHHPRSHAENGRSSSTSQRSPAVTANTHAPTPYLQRKPPPMRIHKSQGDFFSTKDCQLENSSTRGALLDGSGTRGVLIATTYGRISPLVLPSRASPITPAGQGRTSPGIPSVYTATDVVPNPAWNMNKYKKNEIKNKNKEIIAVPWTSRV